MIFVHSIRLARVREMLKAGVSHTTVTSVSYLCRFSNAGQFASANGRRRPCAKAPDDQLLQARSARHPDQGSHGSGQATSILPVRPTLPKAAKNPVLRRSRGRVAMRGAGDVRVLDQVAVAADLGQDILEPV